MRLLAAALLAAAAPLGLGQATSPDDPISTIRPRVTDTTRIVPVGRLQLEAGVSFGYGGFRLNRADGYGQGVLRYGVAPRLEARIELPSYTDYQELDFEDGFGNLSFAVSYYLGRLGPAAFAVEPRFTLPTAVEFRQPQGISPSIFFTGELPLGRGFSLASTVGAIHQRFFDIDFDYYRATLCADYRLDEKTSAFAEYVGLYTSRTGPGHSTNVGLRFRTSSRTQFDLHAASPISNGFPQQSFGFGYAIRF